MRGNKLDLPIEQTICGVLWSTFAIRQLFGANSVMVYSRVSLSCYPSQEICLDINWVSFFNYLWWLIVWLWSSLRNVRTETLGSTFKRVTCGGLHLDIAFY